MSRWDRDHFHVRRKLNTTRFPLSCSHIDAPLIVQGLLIRRYISDEGSGGVLVRGKGDLMAVGLGANDVLDPR